MIKSLQANTKTFEMNLCSLMMAHESELHTYFTDHTQDKCIYCQMIITHYGETPLLPILSSSARHIWKVFRLLWQLCFAQRCFSMMTVEPELHWGKKRENLLYRSHKINVFTVKGSAIKKYLTLRMRPNCRYLVEWVCWMCKQTLFLIK